MTNESKAREFWIYHKYEYSHVYDSPVKELGDANLHVVEYQAYEQACAEVERLRASLEALTNAALAGLKPLQSQVNAAFDALKALETKASETKGEG